MSEISIQWSEHKKKKPVDESSIGFGNVRTDHMFLMDYDAGEGWHDPRIVPYAPLLLDPTAMCLHYAQTVFEGLKAYRGSDGIYLFRPKQNVARLNQSCRRLCIPEIDEELILKAIQTLVAVEADWIPKAPNTSLYIRPFILATEPHLGVKPATQYQCIILLSPSGPYYKGGLKPVDIAVETTYVRAVKGGVGMAKTGGNYAASLLSQVEAEAQGFTQTLWLDGVHRKYIEEVGAMNIFFVLDNEVLTPMINGSILEGVTRDSVIALLKDEGMTVSERRISIDEISDAYEMGRLKEVFGTGTAAVISPVGSLKWGDRTMQFGNGTAGPISQHLYERLTNIQWGRETFSDWSVCLGDGSTYLPA